MRPLVFPFSVKYFDAIGVADQGGYAAGWYVVNAGHCYGGVPLRLITVQPFIISDCCATREAALAAYDALCDEWDDQDAMLSAELGE